MASARANASCHAFLRASLGLAFSTRGCSSSGYASMAIWISCDEDEVAMSHSRRDVGNAPPCTVVGLVLSLGVGVWVYA